MTILKLIMVLSILKVEFNNLNKVFEALDVNLEGVNHSLEGLGIDEDSLKELLNAFRGSSNNNNNSANLN